MSLIPLLQPAKKPERPPCLATSASPSTVSESATSLGSRIADAESIMLIKRWFWPNWDVLESCIAVEEEVAALLEQFAKGHLLAENRNLKEQLLASIMGQSVMLVILAKILGPFPVSTRQTSSCGSWTEISITMLAAKELYVKKLEGTDINSSTNNNIA
ncbi:unnamed protein product [Triticum turgidum subsp. durum]|uniref:Uncharacterized protein n=1 Tax=Triticum turgidum subsp. durum TaxID=4567 RepID=A0A9R1AWT4_TRITD|nr:unnamed protein product [Triticum turgidum subsp. durum]